MTIQQLSLTHFRNFSQVESITLPADALLVAAAPNAMGKTNFLESVVMLLRARSWRASTEACVQWGAPGFVVRGDIVTKEGMDSISVQYRVAGKKLKIERNKEVASPVLFYAQYPVVLFLPEDSFMFTRGPEQRRNFLNQVLLSSGNYLSSLVQYHRIIRQRNAALKRVRSFADIQAWTDLLIENAQVLWQYRRSLTAMIDTEVSDIYAEFSGENHEFSVHLTAPDEAADLNQLLQDAFLNEQRYRYTMIGPHRDDLVITTDGRPVGAVLSRGQMRSLTLALKVIALRLLEQISGEKPVLLLDDILSELDPTRQRILLRHLPSIQTILTCTALPPSLRQRSDVHMLDLRSILSPPSEGGDQEGVAATPMPVRDKVVVQP